MGEMVEMANLQLSSYKKMCAELKIISKESCLKSITRI
jgi:hypothetical protein